MKMISRANNIRVINRGLMGIIAILAVGYAGLGMAIYSLTGNITVYIPPDISAAGATVQANQPPKTTVYSFANYIYQYLNTWQDGARDYPERINNSRFYMTARFQDELQADHDRLQSRNGINELVGRRRELDLDDHFHFDRDSVEILGAGRWRVLLKYRILEHVGQTRVKEARIAVPLTVAKTASDPVSNQWGLRISGMAGRIERIGEGNP